MATRLIAVIILKCIEIQNHYAVPQEILQNQTNKLMEKRSDLWLPETRRRGRVNWMK